ncbi:MATE family efflux transporter [Intestinibacter bartlettii]|uniref:Multidrug export protein MepA n=1 Tax=Intestinibacter bartlettii TaxID=261299 RepID=A0ABS6DZI3_9FIRM|nr:MATE family efflux transporter [Intestinibacter bartlettii]MBU5337253.1 MATE family efflux transporter [Intestinibacter bartlettii]MDO5009732.1 MATE family efflux transporter [Intestinibacter bartlettii]
MQNDQAQFIKMTETPIHKLITSLAIPTIISMLVTAIYNMADTFFVAKLGTSASGAVGIVFSLMAIIQAIGFTLGMGSGSLISRLLGAKQNEKANEIASSGFFTAILFGILLAIFGLINIDNMMKVLGSSQSILPFAKSYAKYILLGAPIMCASFVLNNILRSEGRSRFAMIGIASGSIINIFLDPVLIFGLNMGISGAAIATLVSQAISFCILLSIILRGVTVSKLNIKYMSKSIKTYTLIIKTGLPSFTRQGLASISTVLLNLCAVGYGDAAVAALSIFSKIFMFIFSTVIGFGQGFQPVVGYNYGAKKYDRVKESCFFTLKVGVSIMFICAVVGFIFAPNIIKLFIEDDLEVISIGSRCLRAQCIAMPFIPVCTVCNMTFQMIGKSWTATLLSSTRQGLCFIPILFIGNTLFGLNGIECTQALADFASCVIAIPFAIVFLRNLNLKIKEQKETSQMTLK